jgi:hypothetical protein
MPECSMHEHAFKEGGATWAAAVVTWARALMCVVGLVGRRALHSRDACPLRWCLYLVHSATDVVSLLLDLVMVTLQGVLIGLTVGISVGTLGIGACSCMDCMICLLSLVWGMGMLAGAFTLPPNLLCVARMVGGNGFFKLVGICLYARLCCINNTL